MAGQVRLLSVLQPTGIPRQLLPALQELVLHAAFSKSPDKSWLRAG